MSILNSLFGRERVRSQRFSGPRRPLTRTRKLRVEMLEDRRVLSTTILVDDNGVDCPGAPYTSIQDAIDDAGPGDKIVVCPGTYTEKIVIDSTKNGLALQSKNPLLAIIKAPAGSVFPAIVHVDGADDVAIEGFTITGPFVSAPASELHTGIFVGGGGSAEIEKNHITKIRDEPVSGTQNRVAILIGRTSTSQTGSARIEYNLIDDYQKGAIVVDNAGSGAEIEDNEVVGRGPTSLIAQNGIQISRGATAEIEHNEVSGHSYTVVGPTLAAGILLYDSGEVDVEDNQLTRNDIGIEVTLGTVRVDADGNDISYSYAYGILVRSTTNLELDENIVTRSTLEGILVTEGSTGNRIYKNQSTRNGLDGIHVFDSNDNEVKENKLEKNGRDGIRVDGTSSVNDLLYNTAKSNAEHDFHDDTFGAGTAGTANIWKKNSGKTQNRPGLKK